MHPAIQAIANAKHEYDTRLSRLGHTAILEVISPLWGFFGGISWDINPEASWHCYPRLLVKGTLGDRWFDSSIITPQVSRKFEELGADFTGIDNDMMRVIFGSDTTVTIYSSGSISQEER